MRRDGTALGFILTNTRDKSTTFYRLTGATEDKAMNSAEGAVQEKGYTASFPRPYNINGELTYVMSLKDKEGLIKKLAMVSVENYEVVSVTDPDVKKLISDFIIKVNRYVGNSVLSSGIKYIKYKGTVAYIIHKNEYSVLEISDIDSLGFKVRIDVTDEIEFTKKGDSVIVELFPSNSGVKNVSRFDNLNISFKNSKAEEEILSKQDSTFEKRINDNIEEKIEQVSDSIRKSLK